MAILDRPIPPEVFICVWGFIVGFVCWRSLFRLLGPVSAWILDVDANRNASPVSAWITFAVVVMFGIGVTMFLLSIPLLLELIKGAVSGGETHGVFVVSRHYDYAFISSLAGFFSNGLLLRRKRPAKDKGRH